MLSSPRPSTARSPLVAVLLLIIAALVITLGVFLADRHRLTNELAQARTAQSTDSATSPSEESPDVQKGKTAQDPNAPAPTETRPDVLEILHSQVKRDPHDAQAKGKVDAKVVMVVYSDFACPYCTLFAKDVAPALDDLIEDGTLRIEWRDLAQITASSPLAAQAGRAAAEQNRFWEFHDAVYAAAGEGEHPEYTQESLIEFAKQAGVGDLEAFSRAMNAPETVAAVEAAKQDAYAVGITGTPFMIIGDSFVPGYRGPESVRATVEAQAAAAQ